MSQKNYTMSDFRALMRERGIGKRALERGRMPRPPESRPKPKADKPKKERVTTCAIHPLHTIKVLADGSRTGCDFCDDYIRDLCSLFQSPSTSQDPTD